MKTLAFKTVALSALAVLPTISMAQTGQGTSVRLRIADAACAAVSKGTTNNPNPSDLNDGDLDDAETNAIEQGCAFRATVTDSSGMRVSGENLILRRSEAPYGSFESFGQPRTTDQRGDALWRFQPTPNTDFIYEVTSADGQLRSNTIEIQLCTGDDSVGAIEGAPDADAGRGCQNLQNGGDDNNDDNNVPITP